MAQKTIRILGIESSCDETAAAIVEDGRRIVSDFIRKLPPVSMFWRFIP